MKKAKRILSIILTFAMMISMFTTLSVPTASAEGTTSLVMLRVNGEENPLGIGGDLAFSWQMKSNELGKSQSAYKIDLSNGWSTGKVNSGESTNIKYDGDALDSSTSYTWTVTVWDENGAQITSSPAVFETGLLNQSDYVAKYIAVDREEMALPNPTSYEISTDFKIESSGAGLTFAYQSGSTFLMWGVSSIHGPGGMAETGNVYLRPHKWVNGAAAVINNNVTVDNGCTLVGTSGQIDISAVIPPSENKEWHNMRLVITSPGNTNATGTVDTYIDGIHVARHTGLITKYNMIGFRQVEADRGVTGVANKYWEKACFDNITLTDGASTTYFSEDFSADRGIFTNGGISHKTAEAPRGGYIYVDGTNQGGVMAFSPIKPSDTLGTSSPMFRKEFEIPEGKTVKSARLYATALGQYDAFINGKAVAPDEMLNPGWTDYRTMLMVQAYDVTDMLVTGQNALSSQLGNGWFAGHVSYGNGSNNLNKYGQYPAFLAQMVITYNEGGSQTIVTDDSWTTYTKGPYVATDNQDGETYDARKEVPGWNTASFDDSSWSHAGIVTADNAKTLIGVALASSSKTGFGNTAVNVDNIKLVPHVGPRVKLGTEVSEFEESALGKDVRDVTVVARHPDGRVVLDCGQNIAGVPKITIRGGEAGTQIRLRFAEMLDHGTKGTELGGLQALRSAKATDYYTKKGAGDETYMPRFTWHGFRYLEVTGYPGELDPADVQVYFLGSEMPLTMKLESSSADLNQLYSNVMWSMRDNFLTVPTDCPQRDERLGWTGDAQVFSRTATYNRDTEEFFTKWLRDMKARQRSDGGIWDYNPDEGHDHDIGNAAWADAATIVPWNVYQMYGNKKVLEESYSMMQGHVYFYTMAANNNNSSATAMSKGPFAAFNKENPQQPAITDTGTATDNYKYILGGCAYGDWLAPSGTPNNITATAYFAHSAEILSKAAEVLGKTEDAAYYKALSDRVKKSFERCFYNAETGRISADSQTSYALAIAFDLLPESETPKLAERLAQRVDDANTHLTTGFVGAGLLLPALAEGGYSDLAYTLLLDVDTNPSWLYSIRQGATTTWEHWDSYIDGVGFQYDGMNSFNHYSFGAVMEWVYRFAAGIETDEQNPGFKHINLQPTPDQRLSYLNASFESPYGTVISKWKYENGLYIYDAEIPANTTATVSLPVEDGKGVTVNGNSDLVSLTLETDGVQYIDTVDGKAIFHIVSGKAFQFATEITARYRIKVNVDQENADHFKVKLDGGEATEISSGTSFEYEGGAPVNLEIVPFNDVDFVFDKWVDDKGNTVSTENPLVIDSINASMNLTAKFKWVGGKNILGGIIPDVIHTVNSSFGVVHLTDGVLTSGNNGWSSGNVGAKNPSTPPWVRFDAGEGKQFTFDSIKLYPRNTKTVNGQTMCFPETFVIETSDDGATWTPVVSETGYVSALYKPAVFTFEKTSARFIRLTVTSLNNNDGNTFYLQMAEFGAYLSVDKEALAQAIDEAKGLNETDYTADSWANLVEVLAGAQGVYNNENATQAEVDTAAEALNNAIAALIIAPVTPTATGVLVDDNYQPLDEQSVIVNQKFKFAVTTPADVTKVSVRNESGMNIGKRLITIIDNDNGSKTWIYESSVATVGKIRTLQIWTKTADTTDTYSGSDMVFEVVSPKPVILSASVEETAVVNKPFTLTVTTDQTVTKLDIYNEYKLKMGILSSAYTDIDGSRVWTVTIQAGTMGIRSFDVIAKNKHGNTSDTVRVGPVAISWL
ncbi:MAG: family 78 glycoside hydrolase catalytic domain [Clostridiales bacterium]|nr:family 78 glycoside hydrolase catalytic domain [Clostridiales bacterium]